MKRLIINADGYGFTPGVNEGIIRSFEAGLVRSTSCTPNFGHLGGVGEVARRFPGVSFGIHFNLSVGAPLSPAGQVPSLVGPDGRFHSSGLLQKILTGRVRYAEMVAELTAQAAILADAGVSISHFDGHQNKHLYPGYFEACMQAARRFGIRAVRTHHRLLYLESGPIGTGAAARYYLSHPARVATHLGGRARTRMANRGGFASADRLITPGYADASHKTLPRFWTTLARTLPPGTSEVYCHPAIPDDLLRAHARYVEQREVELRVMTDPAVRQAYDEAGVELINFHDLAASRRAA